MRGGKGLINEQSVQVPRLKIESVQRGFIEHKKCLKLCLKVFDNGTLSQPQKQCITSCLGRYRDSERYLIEKVHHMMHEQALADPNIKPLYDGVGEEARQAIGDKL